MIFFYLELSLFFEIPLAFKETGHRTLFTSFWLRDKQTKSRLEEEKSDYGNICKEKKNSMKRKNFP